MKYLTSFFTILGAIFFLLQNNWFWGVFALWTWIFTHAIDRQLGKWLTLWVVSFFICWLLRWLLFRNHSTYIVLDRRPTWAMVHNGWQAYYLPIDPHLPLDWGDMVAITGEIKPFAMTSYEGKFHFEAYLQQRGMHTMIEVDSIKWLWQSPLRPYAIIEARLTLLDPELRLYVSELLWRKQSLDVNLTDDFLMWVQLSGLGFYMVYQGVGRILALKFNPVYTTIARLILFFPWMLFGLHQWGIVRIYALEIFRLWQPNVFAMKRKIIVLTFMSWVYPNLWLQTSAYLYLIYQGWIFGFAAIRKQSAWRRWMAFSTLGMLWTWISVGKVNLFQSWLFLPTTFINAIFFPLWLGFLYSGVIMPGLVPLTQSWVTLLKQIPIDVDLSLGLLPRWRILMLLGLCFSLLLNQWLHLSRYLRYQWMMIGILILSHLSAWDVVLIDRVSFLNVGQGDATVVQSKGKTMLIDTGGVFQFDLAQEVLIPYFKRQRIRRLDYVIITHDDFDHHGALPSLRQRFHIGQIITEPFARLKLGNFLIQNYQHYRELFNEDNAQSLVIGIQQQTCQWLVMGDATVATEDVIMQTNPGLQASILRLGHHGSLTSTSEAWLDSLQPKEVVISSGGGNRYGHPHPTVIHRLEQRQIKIRRTDKEGTIAYQTCKI
ncbi:MAG: ComEC/Rec2 family competence protein [Bacilli bacterium]